MGKQFFTKTEAAKALRVTPRTVHYYTEEGLVVPEVANPSGRGTTRKYSRRNLMEIMLVREMAASGISLARIKEIMEILKGDKFYRILNPDLDSRFLPQGEELKIIIYDAFGGNFKVDLEQKPNFTMHLGEHRSALVVNVDWIFSLISEL